MKIKEQDAYNTYVQCEIRYPKECSTPTTRKMTNAEKEEFEQRKKKREEKQTYYDYVRKFDLEYSNECYNDRYGYPVY